MSCKTKVCYSELTALSHQKVGGLQVPVNDALAMGKTKAAKELEDEVLEVLRHMKEH